MKIISFLFLLLPFIALSQSTGTAIYKVDKTTEIKKAAAHLPNVDMEKTFAEPLYAYDTLHFDTTERVVRLISGNLRPDIFNTEGKLVRFNMDNYFSYYTFLNPYKRFSYMQLPNGRRCIHQPEVKYSVDLQYTETDTSIAGYNCEKAYFPTSNGKRIYVYTCRDLPTLFNPVLSKFNNLRGGIVLYHNPRQGPKLLHSVTYQKLPQKATQLPQDLEVSEEPCKVFR